MNRTPAPDQQPEGELARSRPAEARALVAMAAATLLVQNGAYAAMAAAGIAPREAVLASLACGIAWVVLVTGPFAAGAATTFRAVLRAGVVADASAVGLIVLCLAARDPVSARRLVPLVAALKIYCTYAAVAMTAAAAVRCARSCPGRAAVGTVVSVVLLAALATPFWIGGILDALVRGDQVARDAGTAFIGEALSFNPFYSIGSAVADRAAFVWHEEGLMYRITAIRDIVAPPPVSWYAAGVRYAVAAAVLAGLALLRRRRPPPAVTTGGPPLAAPENRSAEPRNSAPPARGG